MEVATGGASQVAIGEPSPQFRILRSRTKIHLARVTLGFDNGYSVEATSGIAMDDLIALNLGQSANEGEKVQPVQQKTN